jgi:hypothetical protein
MASRSQGILFYGRLQPVQWPYLYRLLQAMARVYDRLVIPCSGTFTVGELALKAGFKPSQIELSDVSLYSASLGIAIGDGDASVLNVQTNDLKLPDVVNLDTPEGCLYALRYGIFEKRRRSGKMNKYEEMFYADLRRRAKDHLNVLKEQLDAYKVNLSGIRYRSLDMFEHINEWHEDPQTAIAIWPPFSDGDYEKMFDTGDLVTWNEPDFLFYSPKTDYPKLKRLLLERDALSLWYMRNPTPDDVDRCIFAADDGKGQIRALMANKPDLAIRMAGGISVHEQRRPASVSADLPIMPAEHNITDQSSLQVLQCSSVQATYYRDLFVHRMGSTLAERSYLILVDGMVVAVVGVNLMRFNIGDQDYMEETYGIARTSRWWRLGRLLNQTLVCREFMDICSDDKVNRKPTGIRGTVWSRYPESKADRGVFKIVERVYDTKVGMYKIRIHGKAREITLQQTLKDWLKLEATYWAMFPEKRRKIGAEVGLLEPVSAD